MKKRTMMAFVGACMLCACTSASSYKPGTYTGTGEGNNGDVIVQVTVNENAIVKVEVIQQEETAGIADPALEKIPEEIVANNTADVDVISGCTNTSNAIIEAVESALKQAK